jgi:hypothetical protein
MVKRCKVRQAGVFIVNRFVSGYPSPIKKLRAVSPTLDIANGAESTPFRSHGQIAGPSAVTIF